MQIVLSDRAKKSMRRLPANLRRRLLSAIAALPAGDVKKLHGRDGYRLRVGEWRVLYEVAGETITVLDVGPRSGIYQ
jgi:mRNA interferase RelE/StbE